MNSSVGDDVSAQLRKTVRVFLSTHTVSIQCEDLQSSFLRVAWGFGGRASAIYAPVDGNLVLLCDSRDQIFSHRGTGELMMQQYELSVG